MLTPDKRKALLEADASPHDAYLRLLKHAVPRDLARRATGQVALSPEDRAEAEAQAGLIEGLYKTATGKLRGDAKTALGLLRRLDPSWDSFETKDASEGQLGGKDGVAKNDVLVAALRRKGWKVEPPTGR